MTLWSSKGTKIGTKRCIAPIASRCLHWANLPTQVLSGLERSKGEFVGAMAAGAVLFKDAGDARAKLGWLSRGHMKLFMDHAWGLGCPPLLLPQLGDPNPPVQVGNHFKEDKGRDRG